MITQEMHDRIAFFVPSLFGGGAERVMLTLAIGFAEKGMSVDLVLAKAFGPLLANVPSTINVVDLGQSRVIRSVPRLAAYLRRHRPQALLSAMEHANFAAILAKQLAQTNTRLAISLHSTAARVEDDKKTKRTVLKYLLKGVHGYADVVIAVSQGVADDYTAYMNLKRGDVTVIYNPAVRPEIFLKAAEVPCHEWLVAKTEPVVLAVGRLTRAKDYPTLIKAFKTVHHETGAKLLVLGEGEERASMERLIQTEGLADSISMPGFVENPFSFMKRADVFVLSSKWEGFGLVLAEAMALGTPVVSTNCPGGPAEILEDGKWGRLTPVGDVESLAHAIIEVISHPVRDVAVDRARTFSIETILQQYADALHVNT